MKKYSQIAGIFGIVLLLFGIAEFLFARTFSAYTIFHLAAGGCLALLSLAFNLGGVWSTLGSRSTRYSANAVIYSIIFLGILVVVNIVSNKHSIRKDMTESGLFSLSDQTKKVLESLPADVEALAFFQQFKGSKVQDLLENYSHQSPRFTYLHIDPVKHPEKAESHGVTASDVLVIKSGERENKITSITEQDVTNAILKVCSPEQKKIYITEGHGERDLENQEANGYSLVKKAMENENYELKPIKLFLHKDVPEDCAVLVVAGPDKPLEAPELDAIERYINRGGHALFLLDPASAPGLNRYLTKWGVEVGPNVVVDQVFRLFYGPSLGVDPIVEEYGTHDITKDFEGQTLFHLVRSVTPSDEMPPGVSAVSLARTSSESWAETDLDRFFASSEVEKTAEDIAGPVSIATALTVQPKPTDPNAPGGQEAPGEGKVVVFGDSDFASNEYLEKMYNSDLFLNAVSWLAGEESFISVRPKTAKGSRVSMTPEETQAIFYLSVLILPEILLLLGLGIWWRRR